jgi:hypothetical protein
MKRYNPVLRTAYNMETNSREPYVCMEEDPNGAFIPLDDAIRSICWLCGSDNAGKYPLDPSGSFHVSEELTDGFVSCQAAKLR